MTIKNRLRKSVTAEYSEKYQKYLTEKNYSLKRILSEIIDRLVLILDLSSASLSIKSKQLVSEINKIEVQVDLLRDEGVKKILQASAYSQPSFDSIMTTNAFLDLIKLLFQIERITDSADKLASLSTIIHGDDGKRVNTSTDLDASEYIEIDEEESDRESEFIKYITILKDKDVSSVFDLNDFQYQTGYDIIGIKLDKKFVFDIEDRVSLKAGNSILVSGVHDDDGSIKSFFAQRGLKIKESK